MANNLKEKVSGGLSDLRTYWKIPKPGKYIPYREIAAYSGGGIGAYMVITLGMQCLLAVNNTLLSSTLGIDPTHIYIMYVIAVLANIPLTAIRANIIDNTRNKAGKYRPYIVNMAIPTAVICILMVWFPYDKLNIIFGSTPIREGSNLTGGYIAKCVVVMILNLLLHFFYYFFYDGYENLIHVMSPDSQERTNVTAVKSVVYSFAPTIINLFTPIIAQRVFHSNSTDIRVYRLLYPILGIIGILCCIIVYKYTEEKIIQARSHVIQIKFIDALKEVAKNKYFWIISLAGWIGFLEGSFANILFWLYNYGGVCTGTTYGLIVTILGNASLWAMLLSPVCIRKFGKKAVLVVTNLMNIVFILMMFPFTAEIGEHTMIAIAILMYLNNFMGAFIHVLNPAIQADIRDYQQYKTGERIDGMFSAVATIGTLIALATSSVLPQIYEKEGITKAMAEKITSDPQVLARMTKDGVTVGKILEDQLANGQNNYINAYSALYDLDILRTLLHVLIIVSAVGALMNVIPFFWYDFTEKKQKSVVRVLKVRAMFEDYSNNVLDDGALVEAIDIIRSARKNAALEPAKVSKSDYRSVADKEAKKAAKKAYKAALELNEEIDISKFVCDEIDKYSTPLYQYQLKVSTAIHDAGLTTLRNQSAEFIEEEMKKAQALPQGTEEEKEIRKYAISVAKKRKASVKAIKKYFPNEADFVEPDFEALDAMFDKEDALSERIKELYIALKEAKKKDRAEAAHIKAEIKALEKQVKAVKAESKAEMDRHAYFARAAKVYLDAEKVVKQAENYTHFEEIAAQYDEAKVRHEAELQRQQEEAARIKAEEDELARQIKAEKEKAKAEKKANKKDSVSAKK